MGCFSWLDCVTRKQIKIGRGGVRVLIPSDLGGGALVENHYAGYGVFGGVDIYELVARWNRSTLTAANLETAPKISEFGGLYGFQKDELRKEGKTEKEIANIEHETRRKYWIAAKKRRSAMVAMLKDYRRGVDDETMRGKYGNEYERKIGIAVACYDEQNARLRYPIKMTYDKTAIYEDCKPSDGDPNQGC